MLDKDCTGNPLDAPATVDSIALSLIELGELLQEADDLPDFHGRMTELERLVGRVDVRVGQLKDLIVDDHLEAMGGFPLSRRRDGGRS